MDGDTPLECLKNIIPDIEMPRFQNIGLRKVLENKKMLLAFDTGLGKTFVAAQLIRALLNANPDGKHIVIILNDSIKQVPSDIRNLVEVSTEVFDGTSASAGRLRFFWGRTSIFCMTYEAFQVFDVVKILFDHLPEIDSVIIDEAHHVSNWNTSNTAMMIRSIVKWVPYVLALTATPMTSESKQFYRILNLLDRRMSIRRDEGYLGKYVDRYYSVNRSDYNLKGKYKSTLVVVKPTLDQMQPQQGIIFKHLKGSGAVPQVNALVSVVQKRLALGKRIIIYVHYHDSRLWIEEHLRDKGIGFSSLHGKILKREERQNILDSFRNGETDVLITSVTESLNVSADVVIFYEFTTMVKQVIGRAHRGLEGKEIEVVFILTRDSDEIDYFLEYIYKRSITIQKILGKDYNEILRIGKKVAELDRQRLE